MSLKEMKHLLNLSGCETVSDADPSVVWVHEAKAERVHGNVGKEHHSPLCLCSGINVSNILKPTAHLILKRKMLSSASKPGRGGVRGFSLFVSQFSTLKTRFSTVNIIKITVEDNNDTLANYGCVIGKTKMIHGIVWLQKGTGLCRSRRKFL